MQPSHIIPILGIAASVIACDPPPDSPGTNAADTWTGDTQTTGDENRIADTDTLDAPGGSCLEGVMCMLASPMDADDCLSDMDPETQAAAGDVAMCAFSNCLDSLDSNIDLAICLVTNCTEEAAACLTTGTGDLPF